MLRLSVERVLQPPNFHTQMQLIHEYCVCTECALEQRRLRRDGMGQGGVVFLLARKKSQKRIRESQAFGTIVEAHITRQCRLRQYYCIYYQKMKLQKQQNQRSCCTADDSHVFFSFCDHQIGKVAAQKSGNMAADRAEKKRLLL